jgi:oxygen-independent coproporphyrinogen-3 oxidase
MQSWVGLGPSAASQHAGWRGANVADLDQWLGHTANHTRMTEDRVALTPALLLEDSLIFGLRLNAGVDLSALQERFPSVAWPRALTQTLARLEEEGLAERAGGCLRLTTRGRLVADSVGGAIMEALAEPVSA